jgi:hypothetical protein
MAKTKAPRHDDYPPSQATQRRDDALRAALNMGPIPHRVSPISKRIKTTSRPKKKGAAKD